jgi:predicted component of type VI protein secretion system
VLVLRSLQPGASSQSWEVTDRSAEIGRQSGTIVLGDRSVSRRHARISPSAGGFLVEDLNSANGTTINDRQITAPVVLADGDRVAFGDVILLAEVRQPSVPAASVAHPDATVNFLPEMLTPPPVVGGPVAVVSVPVDGERTIADSPAPPVVVVQPPVKPRPKPQAPRPAPPVDGTPVPVAPTSRVPPPVVVVPEASAPRRATRLPEAVQSAGELAESLHGLHNDLTTALHAFEQAGGRGALQAILAQAKRVEANPRGQADLDALIGWLPTVRRLLETEQKLVDLLGPRSSDALS